MNRKIAAFAGAAAIALTIGSAAHAAVIDWASWSSNTAGTIGAVNLTYSGELAGFSLYPSYTPTGSFSGGTVSNAPAATDDTILLTGGTTQVNTVTFSSTVINPVFAIWSLGQANDPTTFNFLNSPVFSIQGGGPSAQYGGASITQAGSVVTGIEGNGVLQFVGAFNSISWTNPSHEYYYGFTVGTPQGGGGVPEPAVWTMMIGGLGMAGAMLRRARQLATAAI